MTIQLCDDHRSNIYTVFEGSSLCFTSLKFQIVIQIGVWVSTCPIDASITKTMLSGFWKIFREIIIKFESYNGIGHLEHLFEQSRFLLMPSWCVDNDHFKSISFELVHSIGRNDDGIDLRIALAKDLNIIGIINPVLFQTSLGPAIKRYPSFGCILLELVKGTGSKSIRAYKTSLPPLFLIVIGHLNPKKQFN